MLSPFITKHGVEPAIGILSLPCCCLLNAAPIIFISFPRLLGKTKELKAILSTVPTGTPAV